MRIIIPIGTYNDRRYSKPWIAVIATWPADQRPELRWGQYLGNASGGELEVDAQIGNIIRWGQRDNRGSNSRNNWGIVGADGQLTDSAPAEARKHWLARRTPPVNARLEDTLDILQMAR